MSDLPRWWARAVAPVVMEAASAPDVSPSAAAAPDDELTAALLPVLADLVMAVHDRDRDGVRRAFDDAALLAGGQLAAAQHLAVLAAGMASPDLAVSQQLWWTIFEPEGHVA